MNGGATRISRRPAIRIRWRGRSLDGRPIQTRPAGQSLFQTRPLPARLIAVHNLLCHYVRLPYRSTCTGQRGYYFFFLILPLTTSFFWVSPSMTASASSSFIDEVTPRRGVRDDDAADVLFAFLKALDNDAVVLRSDVHALFSVRA